MGEATTRSDKVTQNDVIRLREHIYAKRATISSELAELQRRRSQALDAVRRIGGAVGFSALVLLCAASLIRATAEAFSNNKEPGRPDESGPGLTSTLAGFSTVALKLLAESYLRPRLKGMIHQIADSAARRSAS